MKALTVQQPYPFAIMAGIKPVENRTWTTKYRGPLAIHAGARWYSGEADGRFDIEHWTRTFNLPDLGAMARLGGIVGVVDLVDVVTDHPSGFFFGPFGFVLENPRPVEFIPFKGRLGFFDVPNELIKVLA